MPAFMKPYTEQTYALLRIVTGFLFFWHGVQKIFDFPPYPWEAPWFVQYVAGGIELVGGALIMIGLFTAPLAFLSSGLMAFAYWIAHFKASEYLPIMNGGDSAVLYCFVFLYIAARGAGIWSVDNR